MLSSRFLRWLNTTVHMPQNATLTARQLITSQHPALRLGVNYLLLPRHCCLPTCFQLPPHSSITSWLPVAQWMCTDLQPYCSLFPIWQGYSAMVTCRYREICLHFTKGERQKENAFKFQQKESVLRGRSSVSWNSLRFSPVVSITSIRCFIWGYQKGCQGTGMSAGQLQASAGDRGRHLKGRCCATASPLMLHLLCR